MKILAKYKLHKATDLKKDSVSNYVRIQGSRAMCSDGFTMAVVPIVREEDSDKVDGLYNAGVMERLSRQEVVSRDDDSRDYHEINIYKRSVETKDGTSFPAVDTPAPKIPPKQEVDHGFCIELRPADLKRIADAIGCERVLITPVNDGKAVMVENETDSRAYGFLSVTAYHFMDGEKQAWERNEEDEE